MLVAIRSFDRDPHVGKPPSKLFSAWIAGIPLVAGYDSAYSAIGLPGVDYIRVSAPDQLLGELSRLVSDPRYYHSFVHAGNAKAPGISHDAIAKLWLSCFDQRVAPAFEAWKARGGPKLGPVAGRVMDVSRNAASKAKSVLVSGLAQITER